MDIEADLLTSWATALLRRWGYTDADAEFLATTLVDANARGVDSHGVVRIPAYERRIAENLVDTRAVPKVDVSGAVIKVDANGAAGQIAARAAVESALELSREAGIACAAVRGSTHFGTAGYYARWLAGNGAIGIVVSNSEPIVVPHGGKKALLGTNPIAFAAPTESDAVSLDMATSTSAMGKVLIARATGQQVPDTWGVDDAGNPSTDPNAISALLPAAGPKGYGLAFLVEILGGVLSGAAVSHGLGSMYADFDRPQDVGHWILAINIEHFMPVAEFTKRSQALVELAHATEPAAQDNGVLVPGEPEERTRAERLRKGIPIPDEVVNELQQVGERHGVAFP
ncbi:Ldh family oxidoreductase [Arthrobacter castelli]|uniref:Ldh family oxidoreductase n=1 Tax=Arthrobacter castelli TaxID=271431 RepID=UPI0003F61B14|nr:Ldh family oxidoreductase [Arthrobacter castelli]